MSAALINVNNLTIRSYETSNMASGFPLFAIKWAFTSAPQLVLDHLGSCAQKVTFSYSQYFFRKKVVGTHGCLTFVKVVVLQLQIILL